MREDVIRAHAELPALCEHIHLPLQSGSSRVLKAMRRTYDRERYLDRVALIREHVPDCALTTDVIVGFPGETEADFAETLEVVDAVGYDGAFTFVYSPRRGTEAATLPDAGAARRQGRADGAARGARPAPRRERAQRFVGRTLDVLVEGPSRTDPDAAARPHAPQQGRELRPGSPRPGETVRRRRSPRRRARPSRRRGVAAGARRLTVRLIAPSGPRCEHMFVRWERSDRRRGGAGPRCPATATTAIVRTFDAPEALDVRFYEVRGALVAQPRAEASRMPFRWTVNPYRGCTHACVYCFARPTHTYLDFDAGRDFEREIVVKVNAPEVLRAELAPPSWRREHVALGTNTDPYQWVEGRYRLMPGIWEALRDAGDAVLGADEVAAAAARLRAAARARGARWASPRASRSRRSTSGRGGRPSRTRRIRARASRPSPSSTALGIPTGVLVAPLMPGINDAPEQVEAILDLADGRGRHVGRRGGPAPARRGARDLHRLAAAQRPDLVPRYEALYRRGAYAPPAERRRLAALARSGTSTWRGRLARADAGGPPVRDGAGGRANPECAPQRGRQASLF